VGVSTQVGMRDTLLSPPWLVGTSRFYLADGIRVPLATEKLGNKK